MGNVLSVLDSFDASTDTEDTASNLLPEMDLSSVDDLDFAAAEIILTTNSSQLSVVVERGYDADDSDKTDSLAHKVAAAIQHDVAVAKWSRIMDTPTMESGSVDSETARRDVSAYYINIARVLSAISMAIQPEAEVVRNAGDSDDIISPDFSMSRLSFCGSRIRRFAKTAFTGTEDADADTEPETESTVAEMTTLGNQYGIPELHELYFNTDYDNETGAFLGMTDDIKAVYNRDLERFYQAFSGETTVPDHIKRFGDIPLNDNTSDVAKDSKSKDAPSPLFVCKFNESDEVDCDPIFTPDNNEHDGVEPALKSSLITQFAEHLQKMIHSVITRRRALVEIVNKMFVFETQTVDEERKKRPRIRAYLTSDTVEKLVTEAQKIITDMSLQCEIDNRIGDELFTALHAIQTLEGNASQIRGMEHDLDLLIYA